MASGIFKGSVLLAGALFVSACSPTITTHGNMLSKHKIAAITPMASTRSGVERVWGPPTVVSPFDNKVWYYIGETNSRRGVFEHEVEKRQIVKVVFNEEDTVVSVSQVNPDLGREITMVDRKTPSAGKDYTVVQQFVGNLDKFNKPAK